MPFGKRGDKPYNVTANDEAGVWGAWREHGDATAVGGEAFSLRPILQGNLFWRHTWGSEAVTRVWVGVAEEHGRFLLVAPGESPVHHPIVFGADIYVPLNDYLALFGEGTDSNVSGTDGDPSHNRNIDWNSDVVIMSGPSPHLVVDSNGDIQTAINEGLVGRVEDVLIDSASRRRATELSGRTSTNVVVNLPGESSWIGRTLPVRIERAGPHSVWGRPVEIVEIVEVVVMNTAATFIA